MADDHSQLPPESGDEPFPQGDLQPVTGWEAYPSTPIGPPPRRRPRRRRRISAGFFAVVVSLAALGLGVTAVVVSINLGGEPVETVRYVQVRPPEVIGPAPEPGAPTVLPESPPAPITAPVPPAADPSPPAAPTQDADEVTAAPPPTAAPEPAPLPPGYPQEPVVEAADRVEPSVVLLETSQGQGSGIIYDADGIHPHRRPRR